MLACLAEIVHCTIYTGAQNTPTSDGDDIVLFVVFTFHQSRPGILVSLETILGTPRSHSHFCTTFFSGYSLVYSINYNTYSKDNQELNMTIRAADQTSNSRFTNKRTSRSKVRRQRRTDSHRSAHSRTTRHATCVG